MKIELRPRRAGKTSEAIKRAAETGAYIVTVSMKDSQRIFQQAKELGYNIKFPVTFNELHQFNMKTGHVKDLIIDDLDRALDQMFPHHKIHMVTMTGESDES